MSKQTYMILTVNGEIVATAIIANNNSTKKMKMDKWKKVYALHRHQYTVFYSEV